jgi:hypothetical protein
MYICMVDHHLRFPVCGRVGSILFDISIYYQFVIHDAQAIEDGLLLLEVR